MGRFDIPASLLYVLKTTEKEMLSYIGNSLDCTLDCTLFFIAMASRPELNEHIDVMISLAPVSTLDEVNVTIRLLTAFLQPFKVSRLICNQYYFLVLFIRNIFF